MANSTNKLVIKHTENEEWILDYTKNEIKFTTNIGTGMDFSKAWFKKVLLKGLEKQFGVKLEFQKVVLFGWNISEMIPTNFVKGVE